jgi:endoglucanase
MLKIPRIPIHPCGCAALASLLLAGSPVNAQAGTLLDEQFADGERSTQNLPQSAAWYLEAGSRAHSSTVADQTWNILPPSPPSRISAITVFSGAPVSLSPGETLTVSLRLRPTQARGTFRVGLFDSGGARLTSDVVGNSKLLANYRGYDIAGSPEGGAVLSVRSKSASGLWTASAFQPLASAAGALQEDAGFPVSLTIERDAEGKIRLSASVAGVACTAAGGTEVSAFDTIAVLIDGQMGLTGLENIQVKKGPETKSEPAGEMVALAAPSLQVAPMAALAGGSTWYLQASQTSTNDWHTLSTWFSATTGGTNPTAISASDSYVLNRFRALSPSITTGTAVFGGGEIVIANGGTLTVRGSNGVGTRVPKMTATGGLLLNSTSGTHNHTIQALDIASGVLSIKNDAATRTLALTTGTLTGNGEISFGGGGNHRINLGNAALFTGPLSAISGTLTFVADTVTSGPMVIPDTVRVNLTKTIAVTSLKLTGTTLTPAPGEAPKSFVFSPGTYSFSQLNAAYPAIFPTGTTGGAIIVRQAQTYYLKVNQAVGANWTSAYASHWSTSPSGSGTNTLAINPVDEYSTNGKLLRAPEFTDTFQGKTLIIDGGGLALKIWSPGLTTVPSLFATSGTIGSYLGSGNIAPLKVNFFTQSTGTTHFTGATNHIIDLNIDYLSGNGALRSSGIGEVRLTVGDGSQFTGTFVHTSGTLRLNAITTGPAHMQNSPFAIKGKLTVSSGAKVVLNRDTYVGGLTVSGTVKPNGTYSAATLGFSGTAKIVVYTPDLTGPPQLFGINFASGTFSQDGALFSTVPAEWDYYQSKGLTLIRVPFNWQQVQTALNGSLNTAIMNKLDTILSLANARGMKVIFDMHNYGVYKDNTQIIGTVVPYSAYQDVWSKLSAHFATNPNRAALFGFDIMNEPVKMGAGWLEGLKYAIAGIRAHDMTSYIIVEGKGWAGAQDWTNGNSDLWAIDPACRVIYSAHSYWSKTNNDQYVSYDSEGAYEKLGITKMRPFVDWVKKRKFYGLIGEYGVPTNYSSPDQRWHDLLRASLQYMRDNGILGTYWANGRAFPGYPLAADKGTNPPQDAPAMSVLDDFHQ